MSNDEFDEEYFYRLSGQQQDPKHKYTLEVIDHIVKGLNRPNYYEIAAWISVGFFSCIIIIMAIELALT